MLKMMVVITLKNDLVALRAYTGVVHETKQSALEEYLEAGKDPDVSQAFIMLVG